MPKFRHLCQDQRGTAVVELGLAAPILACMLMGMTDIANVYSRKLALEQGAQRAIEKQMQTTEETTPEDTIKSEAALQANVDPTDVSVEYIRLCGSTRQTDRTADCTGGAVQADYLVVTVSDSYDPIFPVTFGQTQANGTYLVVAKAGMRTQ